MAEPLERLRAERLLQAREQGGQSYGTFLRLSAKPYAAGLVIFGASLAVAAELHLWPVFYFTLGTYVGMVARDYGWVRGLRKSWPFTLMVINWETVRSIAESGKPGED